MKRVILAVFLAMGILLVKGQSWNPYVSQGIITPLLPAELNEPGMASFNLGNTGSMPLLFDGSNQVNNLSLVIWLSDGVPDRDDPVASLKGEGVGYFSWNYDSGTRTYVGHQKMNIPGYFQTSISVGFQPDHNSPLQIASNGFKVELKVPDYMKAANATQDDKVSSYTATRAFDYGDAPQSYGTARHEIDMNRDPVTNDYTRFILLGNIVRHDMEPAYSDLAMKAADDDDDDGVTFPLLSPGNSYTIPVMVTVHGESRGFLNAWFDWDGDGNFNGKGEKVTQVPIPVYSTGTVPLTVTVPEDVKSDAFTFARFRIGANGGPSGNIAWGEVEDYRVFIYPPELNASLEVIQPLIHGENTGEINLSVTGGKLPYTFEWSNGSVSQDIRDLSPGDYQVKIRDANQNEFTLSATIAWPGLLPDVKEQDVFRITVYPNPVVDDYYVSISREGKYHLELIDQAGSLVMNKVVEITSGEGNRVRLHRGGLVSGAYILRVNDVNSEMFRNFKLNMMQLK